MQLSFKTKFLFFFCPVIVLISLAYTITAVRVEQRLLREEIIKRGEVLTSIAAKNAELPLLSGSEELLNNAAFSISEIKNVPFVTLYASQFDSIIHQGIAADMIPPENLTPESGFSVREQSEYFEFFAPVFSIRTGDIIDMFEEAYPTKLQKEHIGWVRVGLSKEVMNKTVQNMRRNGILFSLGLVIISIVLITLFLNYMLRPLNTLFNAAKNLREGEYPQVPLINQNDEIGQLSAEFNKMSSAIKDREQLLLCSQKRISDLFERVEHAIFWLAPDFKIIEGNSKFRQICGEISDFFNLLEAEKREDCMKAAIAGELVGKEVIITSSEGQQHTITLSIYPEIGEEGNYTGFDGHFVDITEKKRMEEIMRQNQKLESLGLLAGGIAHDFNNILTVIIGYSDLIAKKTTADDPLHAHITAIREHGMKAAQLTRQLLAFSRKQVMELKIINLNDLINNMAKMLDRLIGETIEMELLPHPMLGNIKADPSQIEQIVMNLTVNAKDSMPDGGKLVLKTDSVTLDDEFCKTHENLSPGKYVLLAITDTGYGMIPGVQERIFDPFFTTKEKGAGTGLGLSTVYGIVRQLKGYIYVYSENGRGTTFKIYFPEVEEVIKEVAPQNISKDALQGEETILVVDDETAIRNLIRDALQPLGYRVVEANSDEAALDWCNTPDLSIDLLLTDVVMPGMGGRKLADTIQKIMPEMKVLFMSGYTDDVIAQQGVLSPGVLFINKPLIPSILAKKIREILDE